MLEIVTAPTTQRKPSADWSIVPFKAMEVGQAVKLPRGFSNLPNIRCTVGAKGDQHGKKFGVNVINGDVYITRRA